MPFNIDYTNLKMEASTNDIALLCHKAMEEGYETVCVLPSFVTLAKDFLKDSFVNVSTLIASSTPNSKVYEAIDSISMGADEISMYINVSAIIDEDYEYVKTEIEEVRNSIDGKILKVIVPSNVLNEEQFVKAVEICSQSFVNYIEIYNYNIDKTIELVNLIKKYKNEALEIKVSGVLEDDINLLIEKGVNRIGLEV